MFQDHHVLLFVQHPQSSRVAPQTPTRTRLAGSGFKGLGLWVLKGLMVEGLGFRL